MPKPDLTPLDLSDEDLDRLAEITERDIILAQRFAARNMEQRYKNLLLAESQELALDELLRKDSRSDQENALVRRLLKFDELPGYRIQEENNE